MGVCLCFNDVITHLVRRGFIFTITTFLAGEKGEKYA